MDFDSGRGGYGSILQKEMEASAGPLALCCYCWRRRCCACCLPSCLHTLMLHPATLPPPATLSPCPAAHRTSCAALHCTAGAAGHDGQLVRGDELWSHGRLPPGWRQGARRPAQPLPRRGRRAMRACLTSRPPTLSALPFLFNRFVTFLLALSALSLPLTLPAPISPHNLLARASLPCPTTSSASSFWRVTGCRGVCLASSSYRSVATCGAEKAAAATGGPALRSEVRLPPGCPAGWPQACAMFGWAALGCSRPARRLPPHRSGKKGASRPHPQWAGPGCRPWPAACRAWVSHAPGACSRLRFRDKQPPHSGAVRGCGRLT